MVRYPTTLPGSLYVALLRATVLHVTHSALPDMRVQGRGGKGLGGDVGGALILDVTRGRDLSDDAKCMEVWRLLL